MVSVIVLPTELPKFIVPVEFIVNKHPAAEEGVTAPLISNVPVPTVIDVIREAEDPVIVNDPPIFTAPLPILINRVLVPPVAG